MTLARRWPLAILVAVFLAVPSLAHAATYCVNAAGCSGTTEPDLQSALNAAMGSTTEADTVQVGDAGAVPASGYVYADGGLPPNQVHIVGAGPSNTVLSRSTPGTVLTLIGPGSTLSGVGIQLPAGSSTGIVTSGSLDNVNVSSTDPGTGSQQVADFIGSGPAEHWIGGTLVLPAGSGSHLGIANTMSPGTSLDLENLSLNASSQGINGGTGNTTTLRRDAVASQIGFLAQGDTMTLDNVTYRASGPPGVFAVSGTSLGNNASFVANHVTAIGDATPGGVGLIASGTTNNLTGTVTLRNSIMRGFFYSAERQASGTGAVANLNISYSDLDLLHVIDTNSGGGTGSIVKGAGVIDSDPLLANPLGGDFSLKPGSPALDAGDPAGLQAGDSSTDVLGAPRISNGRQDMGAVELQVPPVPAPPARDTTAPSLKLSKLPKTLKLKNLLAGLTFTVAPSEPSSLDATLAGSASSVKLAKAFNFTLAHKKLGLAAGKRRITLKLNKRLIGRSRRFSVRLTVVGTDAAGNKRTLTRTIKVR